MQQGGRINQRAYKNVNICHYKDVCVCINQLGERTDICLNMTSKAALLNGVLKSHFAVVWIHIIKNKCIMVAIIPVCNIPKQQRTNISDVLPTAAVQVLYHVIYMHPC